MTFTFILVISPQSFVPALGPLRIALLAAGAAIGTYVYQRFRRGEPLLSLRRGMGPAIALLAWSVLTIPFSVWPGGSLAFLLEVYAKTLAVFWLVSCTVNTLDRLRTVAWGLTLMTLPLAWTAVRDFFSGVYVLDGVHEKVRRISGYDAPLTDNPNDLALMLNLILPLAIALLFVTRRPLMRGALVAIVALNVVAIVATFSRAGFLTLATTAALYFMKMMRRPGRGWALAAVAVVALCMPLLPPDYLSRLNTIRDVDADPTGSAQARLGDSIVAMRYVISNPILGAGLGMDVLALNEERGALWKEVHNAYLEYAVDLGLPGLVLFLLLMAVCLGGVMSVLKRCAGRPAFREHVFLAEGVQVSLIAFAIAAMFHPVGYAFYFYYIAGLAIALRAVCRPEGDQV